MRNEPRERDQYAYYLLPFFWHQRRKYGVVIELTGLIAFQNMSRKFNSALDLPSQEFSEIPSSHGNVLTAK